MSAKKLPFKKNYDLNRWIISDTHFFHNNIIRYQGRPKNHDELMHQNWLATVDPTDKILHLGDLVLGKRERMKELSGLTGEKELILGNHDRRPLDDYRKIGFYPRENGFQTSFQDWNIIFVHRPEEAQLKSMHKKVAEKFIVCHGHIHTGHYHKNSPRGKNYINFSVEVIDYRPVWLPEVLEKKITELS